MTKGSWSALGREGRRRLRPLGLDIPGRVQLARAARAASAGWPRWVSCLKITRPAPPTASRPPPQEMGPRPRSSRPRRQPHQCAHRGLQMIHPIPADSWRNLIEQIGGAWRRRGVTGGIEGSLVGLHGSLLLNAVCAPPGQNALRQGRLLTYLALMVPCKLPPVTSKLYNWALSKCVSFLAP